MFTPKPMDASFSPLNLNERPLLWKISAVLIGTVILALSSYIEVPMLPVPITMQTFAVTLVGALLGWRLGALTVAAWLLEGAMGMPVLAGGAAGLHHFAGPTAGYLFAFPIAAAVTGFLAEQGWNGRKPVLAFVAMLVGNGLCLILGAAWLGLAIGLEQAMMLGVLPFLLGAVLKSALAALALRAAVRG